MGDKLKLRNGGQDEVTSDNASDRAAKSYLLDAIGVFPDSLPDAVRRLSQVVILRKREGNLRECSGLSNRIGDLYRGQDNFLAAIGWYKTANFFSPSAFSSYMIGHLLKEALKVEGYERYFRSAIEASPDYGEFISRVDQWSPESNS